MKRNIILSISLCAIALIFWQCSEKDEARKLDLKSSLNTSVSKLNNAIDEIKATQGYKLLYIQDEVSLKSASNVQLINCEDSIDIEDIQGIYIYKPEKFTNWCYYCYDRLFKRIGDSNKLIVKMPKEKIFSPKKFRNHTNADTLLKNNFEITASKYHYYCNKPYLFDYELLTSSVLDNNHIGDLYIHSSCSDVSTSNYTSQFTFDNGCSINVNISKGDTSITSLGLTNSDGILFEETVKKIKSDKKCHHEKEYSLIIGNIEIKRFPAQDSIEIYVNGLLQKNAKVEIIDNNSNEETSICKKRDILITFDDGSTAKLSELAGPAITTFSGLVESMTNIYFGANIVNYIAYNIWKNPGCNK